jgi:hypothetical protein
MTKGLPWGKKRLGVCTIQEHVYSLVGLIIHIPHSEEMRVSFGKVLDHFIAKGYKMFPYGDILLSKDVLLQRKPDDIVQFVLVQSTLPDGYSEQVFLHYIDETDAHPPLEVEDVHSFHFYRKHVLVLTQ